MCLAKVENTGDLEGEGSEGRRTQKKLKMKKKALVKDSLALWLSSTGNKRPLVLSIRPEPASPSCESHDKTQDFPFDVIGGGTARCRSCGL